MTVEVFAICLSFMGVATVIGFGVAQLRFNKLCRLQKKELGSISKVLLAKNNVIMAEMNDLHTWLTDVLPTVMITATFTDKKIAAIRDNSNLKTEEFYSAFQEPFISIQETVIRRVLLAVEEINKTTMQSVKDLVDGQ